MTMKISPFIEFHLELPFIAESDEITTRNPKL